MTFKIHFDNQDFDQAATAFDELSSIEQSSTLKELYYEARNAKQPFAVSVLRRQLKGSRWVNTSMADPRV